LVALVVKVDPSDKQNGDRSHVIVSVREEGGGIPGEFLSQVFERVYHKDDQPVPGLGGAELPAVKKLVDTFGGRVWAETEPGVGSTFSFLLPAVTA
jgi:signal transduction histidine kinase